MIYSYSFAKHEKFVGDCVLTLPVSSQFDEKLPSSPQKQSSHSGVGARVFQNTAVLLGGRGAGLLLSAATSVILARYLGRERLGEYGALYAYLTLYSWLATFGLESVLAREAAQRRLEASSIFLTGSVISLVFATAGTGLALLLAPVFGYGGSLRLLLVVAAIDILLIPSIRISGIIFQVDMQQWYGVGIGLIRQMLWLLAVVLLALGKAAFLWVILARTGCGLVEAGLILFVTLQRRFLSRPWTFSLDRARQLIRYGFPVALNVVAVGIYHRIDQVMLHKIASDQMLGPYVVAVQLVEQFSALPVALISALFPVLSQMSAQEEQFRHYLGVSYRFLMSVVFAVCAVLTPIAGPLVDFFYGKAFHSSAGLLIVLVWSEVPIFFGVVISNALVAKNLQRYLPASTVAGAVMNVALNLFMIPRWGALGASWATVVSYSFAGIFLFLLIPKTRTFALQGLRIAFPSFLVALGITLALMLLPGPFWWKFVAACICFGAGAWLTGAIRRSELERAWELVRSNLAYVRSWSN
jgi:PST family polysaccharide transporter